jgi:anti-anti-sigma factor
MALAVIDRSPLVEITGELDLSSGDELEALVAPMLTQGAEVAILLRDVTFADSSGLGALLSLLQQAEEQGAQLVLVEPSPAIERVLLVTATTDLFRIVPSRPAV